MEGGSSLGRHATPALLCTPAHGNMCLTHVRKCWPPNMRAHPDPTVASVLVSHPIPPAPLPLSLLLLPPNIT